MKGTLKRAWMALLLMPVFISCATYNSSMNTYYASLQSHDYDKALKRLESNKFIGRSRNKLLYQLEKGKLFFLKKDPAQSNIHFNQADELMESARKSAADIALGNLVNPMMQTYRGEDFELFMVHFYKALNYVALGQPQEAVVEARRITLATDRQSDKFKNESKRYSKDAFALNLQGMIYEQAGDMNNAFIAYRNAVDVYLKAGDAYYGVTIPAQLPQDLLRSAASMGFTDEQTRYEKLLKTNLSPGSSTAGELILFFEEGRAPVKQERNFFLTNAGGAVGFNYLDPNGYNSYLPFNNSYYGFNEAKLSAVRTLRVAMPVYQVQYARPTQKSIELNGISYQPQLAQDINTVAVQVMKERFATELANAVARQLAKKLLEKGTEKAAESIAKKNDNKSDKSNLSEKEKEEKRKKNEENAKAAGEVAGMLINLANTLTEKADTRNWQSLPAYISYVRIPLTEGENTLMLQLGGKTKVLKVTGGKGLQMMLELMD